MFDEAISLISMWSSMNSWLTPTVLFLLLNLMIGTIAFTSAFTSHNPPHHHPHEQTTFHHPHSLLHHQQPPHHLQHQQHQLQPLLSRSSSVIQRLKSINFSNLYTFYSYPSATHSQHPQPESEPEPEPEKTTSQTTAEEDDAPSMEDIYNRIKQTNQLPHHGRQNSDTRPSGGEVPVKLPKKMKKSASHKSAFNHFQTRRTTDNTSNNDDNHNAGVNRKSVETVEEEERESVPAVKEEREDEGVDARADDFIYNFKKQLQIESLVGIKK